MGSRWWTPTTFLILGVRAWLGSLRLDLLETPFGGHFGVVRAVLQLRCTQARAQSIRVPSNYEYAFLIDSMHCCITAITAKTLVEWQEKQLYIYINICIIIIMCAYIYRDNINISM